MTQDLNGVRLSHPGYRRENAAPENAVTSSAV